MKCVVFFVDPFSRVLFLCATNWQVGANNLEETGSCSENTVAKVPMIHGELYIVFKVSNDFDNYGDDTTNVKINFTINSCEIEQCPINTWYNTTSEACQRCGMSGYDDNSGNYLYYYNDVDGSTSADDCQRCPYHRKLKDKENYWCDVEECQVVYITHDNGIGNQIDGLYYNLGQVINNNGNTITKYLSYSLTKLIDYNLNSDRFEIIDLQNNSNIIAYSESNSDRMYQYPFQFNEENNWYEDGIIYYNDIPKEKIQMIKITQLRNSTYGGTQSTNALQIAEIKVFPKSDPDTNIAPTNATCYNLPINPTYYYYTGDDKTGVDTTLNDNDITTAAINNDPDGEDNGWCKANNCSQFCILDEPIAVSHIILYPPQNNWRWFRSADILIEFYNNGTILNDWTLDDSNVNNSILDNGNFEYGEIVYSNSNYYLGDWNSTFNTSNLRIITDYNTPLVIDCPYRYSFDCQTELDNLCDDNEGKKAIKTGLSNTDNDDITWRCINRTWLTTDELNYIHEYWSYDKFGSYIYQWLWWLVDDAIDVVNGCEETYGISNVTNYDCRRNDNIFECEMYEFLNNDGNVIEIYDKLAMYVQFIAIQNVTSAISNGETYHFPIAGKVYVTDTKSVYSEIEIPKDCQGDWIISLTIDQTPIGGVELDLYQASYSVSGGGSNSDVNDYYCVEFDCDSILSSVDMFEANIVNTISYFRDIYDNYCGSVFSDKSTASPTEMASIEETIARDPTTTSEVGDVGVMNSCDYLCHVGLALFVFSFIWTI